MINEIAWMGTQASTADEWIELYNDGSSAVSLEGWVLRSDKDDKPHILLSGAIPGKSYYLIERTNDETIGNVSADLVTSFGSGPGLGLGNDGERLILINKAGLVVDEAGMPNEAWFAGDNTTKASMERIYAHQRGTLVSSWHTYANTSGSAHDAKGKPVLGTPRMKNSVTTE